MKRAIPLMAILAILFAAGTIYASEIIEVTSADNFHFYSTNSSEVDDGYYASVVVNGVPYYLNETHCNELCRFSDRFATGILTQFHNATSIDNVKTGTATVTTLKNQSNPVGDFEKEVDEEFSFHYRTGKAGTDNNARIVTELYLNDAS